MSELNPKIKTITDVFNTYCEKNEYQLKESKEAQNIRLDISNYSERSIVNIYYTGTVSIRGQECNLKNEMEKLKEEIKEKTQPFVEEGIQKKQACNSIYDIMLPKMRTKIKNLLIELGDYYEIPATSVGLEYRARITKNDSNVTVSQFNNGTLVLQGRQDLLFNECCDTVEIIAHPSKEDVIKRFMADDEEKAILTSDFDSNAFLELADENVRDKIGNLYGYLKLHDLTWLIASQYYCSIDHPFSEFSPLVMPASKAYEGFCKQILIDIDLFEPTYFKAKNASFGPLVDKSNGRRKKICTKSKYASTFLDRLALGLDLYRHYYMHSDDEEITKVYSKEKAVEIVDSILELMKEVFDYFNTDYDLS